MSANNANSHRSHRGEVVELGNRRRSRVGTLLALRDRLASAAAEYEAHEIEGAIDLQRNLIDVESAIKSLAPRVFAAHWVEWVERDAYLAHTTEVPHPDCGVCKMVSLVMRTPTQLLDDARQVS